MYFISLIVSILGILVANILTFKVKELNSCCLFGEKCSNSTNIEVRLLIKGFSERERAIVIETDGFENKA